MIVEDKLEMIGGGLRFFLLCHQEQFSSAHLQLAGISFLDAVVSGTNVFEHRNTRAARIRVGSGGAKPHGAQ